MNDEELIERVREGFAPEPLDDAGVRRFDAALESRLGGRPRHTWALVPAALAAALLVWWLPARDPEPPAPPAQVAELEPAVLGTLVAAGGDPLEWVEEAEQEPWEAELDDAASRMLPREYVALAEILRPDDGGDPLEVYQ